MTTPNPKFDMEREQQDLKVYFFTVQGGPVNVEFPEDFKAVMAYNDQGAIENLQRSYPAGVVITMRKRGEVPIKNILEAVNLQVAGVPQDLKIVVTPPPLRGKTVQDFVHGLMLILNEYVTIKKDRIALDKIIKRIKYANKGL